MSYKNNHIKLKHSSQFSSKIIFSDVAYIIHTDAKGNGSTKAYSRIFLNGKILFSKEADFSHLIGTDDFLRKLDNLMTQLQKSAAAQFNDMLIKSRKKKSEYLNEAIILLRQGKDKEALQLLKDGLTVFPNEPLLISYYGSLYSQVEKKTREGVRICRDAISKLNDLPPVSRESLYPIFYLNLGRAYLGGNKKREAFRAFNIGLKSDPANTNIITEIDKIGKRKKPVLPFLGRNNSMNKYLGLFLGKTGVLKN